MSASTLPKCCRCGAETPAWELTKAGDVCLMCVVIERDELGRLAEAAERAIEKANDARRAAWDRLDRVRAALNGADVVDGPDMGLEDRVDVLVGELEYLRPLRSKNEPEAPKPDAGSHAEVRRALETMLTTYDLMLANSQPAVRMLVEGWFAESLPHVRATLASSPAEDSVELLPPADAMEDLEERACRVCGCTDAWGCDGGCLWAEEDLCSECVDDDEPEPSCTCGHVQHEHGDPSTARGCHGVGECGVEGDGGARCTCTAFAAAEASR